MPRDPRGFLMLGIMPLYELQALRESDEWSKDLLTPELWTAETFAIRQGDATTAGKAGRTVDITVQRGEATVVFKDVHPSLKLQGDRYGIGIALTNDDRNAVVAGTVEASPARAAGIPAGVTLTSIAGKPVKTWFDVRSA